MIGLGAVATRRFLDLDEVADVDIAPEPAPGRRRANGPMRAPAPIRAPSMWQLALISAPSSTVTPGPKNTLGSITTSRPSHVS